MQEREAKLAVISELVQRANALDEDWLDRKVCFVCMPHNMNMNLT